jgi:hypothetical protein
MYMMVMDTRVACMDMDWRIRQNCLFVAGHECARTRNYFLVVVVAVTVKQQAKRATHRTAEGACADHGFDHVTYHRHFFNVFVAKILLISYPSKASHNPRVWHIFPSSWPAGDDVVPII